MSDQTVMRPLTLEDNDYRRIKCPFEIQFTKEFLEGLKYAASFLDTWDARTLTKDAASLLDEAPFSEIEDMANGTEGRLDMCGFDSFDLGPVLCYPAAIMLRKEDIVNFGAYYTFRLLEEQSRRQGG